MIFAPWLLSVLMSLDSHPFSPGEELVFQVRTLGVKSGTAQFNVGAAEEVEGVPAWPIVMVARSSGVTDALYPIRDRFVSFWDPIVRLPVEGRLTANEGGKQRSVAIRFRRRGPQGPQAEVMISDPRDTTTSVQEMDKDAQDLQSAVYWLRTRPLEPGERDTVSIVAGKRQWLMTAEVVGQESLETPAGRFDARRVQISTSFAGKLQSRKAIEAYFSADARHLPLRFDADLMLGKMTAELIRFEVGESL
jgi:Protein of unknown function (DUF3108)